MGRNRILKRILQELNADDVVWSSFDVIGDIAVLRAGYDEKEIRNRLGLLKLVGERLLNELPYLRSVYLAYSPVHGEYRTRKLLYLSGKKETTTIYVEHGCKFFVDVEKTYVSPRLSFEHLRIAELVKKGEVVTNLFAGVGLFSIIIAVKSEPRKVYSIDINPDAYNLMIKNIKINNVEEKVKAFLGDARIIVREKLAGKADRILMPLPSFDKTFYEAAIAGLKEQKGYIHAYEFVRYVGNNKKEIVEVGFKKLSNIIDTKKHRLELVGGRVVRTVGPRVYQVVMDIEVS